MTRRLGAGTSSGGGAPSSARALVLLYIASGVLTLGEGSLIVLLSPYLESRGLAEATIGTVAAVYGVASLLARLPAGMAYRSHRGPALVAGGCLISALAFLGLPLTGNPILLGGLVGLDGIGFAVATTGALAALMERRPAGAGAGSVMGWYTGSVGAGYAVSGFVAGPLGDALSVSSAIFVLASIPLASAFLLALALRVARPPTGAESTPPTSLRDRLGGFAGAPSAVWLAFFVTLYINLVSGVLLTFFPLYGLAIGLSLTRIGLLIGIHGTLAAAVRFGSGLLFRWVSYRGALPAMVLVSGVAVVALGIFRAFFVLAVAWGVIGLARGVLRVASGALVLDEAGASDSERGGASAIYLAGLDLGKILGPLIGGVSAELVGLRATFVAIGVAFPAVYLTLTVWLRSRSTGPAELEQAAAAKRTEFLEQTSLD